MYVLNIGPFHIIHAIKDIYPPDYQVITINFHIFRKARELCVLRAPASGQSLLLLLRACVLRFRTR